MSEYDEKYWSWGSGNKDGDISSMLGKTFSSVRVTPSQDRMIFENDEEVYVFTHFQDCCEYVVINDIVGDLSDLENSPLLECEEVSGHGVGEQPSEYSESYTWTFYKFGTIKGHVNVRWLGESNGYYSESVDLVYEKKNEST